ncbi:hypothetical protein [Hymenobacter metallilatus]|uniref:STAS/SEC14 domain-containing protein n=1 Tax=Hymenobacter metallilatus TaxID=2493666 RepID=A0A428JCW3_9BACT|nr:hypothetical protein [Hymenobacter metallilatus]RSK30094.1 hypothetical protein EI290_14650 [Hymenobacter metallilatus]
MPSTSALTDLLTLQHRPELGVTEVRWLRPAAAQELQQSYTLVLTSARNRRYWLLDLRQRGPASEDDTHWVLTQFVPQLAARAHGRVYLAFLVAASQLSPEEQESGSPMVLTDQAHVRLFANDAPALRWLAGRQHHESS